jgi:hypothetical protein
MASLDGKGARYSDETQLNNGHAWNTTIFPAALADTMWTPIVGDRHRRDIGGGRRAVLITAQGVLRTKPSLGSLGLLQIKAWFQGMVQRWIDFQLAKSYWHRDIIDVFHNPVLEQSYCQRLTEG